MFDETVASWLSANSSLLTPARRLALAQSGQACAELAKETAKAGAATTHVPSSISGRQPAAAQATKGTLYHKPKPWRGNSFVPKAADAMLPSGSQRPSTNGSHASPTTPAPPAKAGVVVIDVAFAVATYESVAKQAEADLKREAEEDAERKKKQEEAATKADNDSQKAEPAAAAPAASSPPADNESGKKPQNDTAAADTTANGATKEPQGAASTKTSTNASSSQAAGPPAAGSPSK